MGSAPTAITYTLDCGHEVTQDAGWATTGKLCCGECGEYTRIATAAIPGTDYRQGLGGRSADTPLDVLLSEPAPGPPDMGMRGALSALGEAEREREQVIAVLSGVIKALTSANRVIADIASDRDYWKSKALEADPGLTPCSSCGRPADAHTALDGECDRARGDVIAAGAEA